MVNKDSILDTYGYGLISSDEVEDEINFNTINEDENIIVNNNLTKKLNENSYSENDPEEYYDNDKDPEYNPLKNVQSDNTSKQLEDKDICGLDDQIEVNLSNEKKSDQRFKLPSISNQAAQ
ncbi:Hypothetical protein CINCED_3A025824 [Cinara cedri]|uniref:Uncharacterized protein n=1 Tax=Cinara cedri TaxID=506608 RepID=A0A5E4LXZ3_9HEMI|nr:Hypothetical protein CINCED_3A025824 [Cinara cedri]